MLWIVQMYNVLVTYFGLCIISGMWTQAHVCAYMYVCIMYTFMYICLYICMHVCITHKHTHTNVRLFDKKIDTCSANIVTCLMRNLRHRIWEDMNSTPAIPTSLYQLLTSPFHQQHRIWIIFFLSHTQQSSFLHITSSSKHCMQIHRQISNCNTKTDDDDKIS